MYRRQRLAAKKDIEVYKKLKNFNSVHAKQRTIEDSMRNIPMRCDRINAWKEMERRGSNPRQGAVNAQFVL